MDWLGFLPVILRSSQDTHSAFATKNSTSPSHLDLPNGRSAKGHFSGSMWPSLWSYRPPALPA